MVIMIIIIIIDYMQKNSQCKQDGDWDETVNHIISK